MLNATTFHGSPRRAAKVMSTAVPAVASKAPTRWLMLLKRSPGYMVYLPDGYGCMEG